MMDVKVKRNIRNIMLKLFIIYPFYLQISAMNDFRLQTELNEELGIQGYKYLKSFVIFHIIISGYI